ncbi:MAG: GNAT family N-acetyltransferase [Planctomycetota bacterium]|jgi:GNAT superfamily N-acetyltransferase
MEIQVRLPRLADEEPCAALAATVMGEARAAPFIQSHFREHRIIVAEAEEQVVGFLAWRTDWFDSSFVSRVLVHEEFRRKGIAREFYKAVEHLSPHPRVYSSTDEVNVESMKMHESFGYEPAGHLEFLPQETREMFWFKAVQPRAPQPGQKVLGEEV